MLGIATGARLQANKNLEHDLDLLAAIECPAIRTYLPWAGIERVLGSGDYDWTDPDRIHAACIEREIEIVWGIGTRGDGHTYDQDHVDAVTPFAEAAARRYGPIGWEGVNEGFFPKVDTDPSPQRYLAFQAALYAGIKAGDPQALVGTGGIIGRAQHLEDLYAALDTTPDPHAVLQTPWDFVTWHPYTRPRSWKQAKHDGHGGWPAMLDAREVMVAHGDAAMQMWITEVGWNTAGHAAVSELDQGLFIADAVRRFRRRSWAGPMFLFTGWDVAGNDEGDSMGLYRPDDSPKPSAQVFVALQAAA